MDLSSKVYWLKIVLAIVVGLINGFTGILHWQGVVIGIAVLFGSYPLSLLLMRTAQSEPELAELTPFKILTTGLLPYLFVFVVTWTLVFNFLLVL